MTVFGLNSGNDSVADLEAFTAAFQPTFPILLGAHTTYTQYRQTGATSPYPLDYVIDQAGKVAYFSTEYDPEAMIAVIDELLLHPAPVRDVPASVGLALQVAPNPFNPRTSISFNLESAGPVTVRIHDPRGRLVRTLAADEHLTAGTHDMVWNGTRTDGSAAAAGAYLVHLMTAQGQEVQKLTLLK